MKRVLTGLLTILMLAVLAMPQKVYAEEEDLSLFHQYYLVQFRSNEQTSDNLKPEDILPLDDESLDKLRDIYNLPDEAVILTGYSKLATGSTLSYRFRDRDKDATGKFTGTANATANELKNQFFPDAGNKIALVVRERTGASNDTETLDINGVTVSFQIKWTTKSGTEITQNIINHKAATKSVIVTKNLDQGEVKYYVNLSNFEEATPFWNATYVITYSLDEIPGYKPVRIEENGNQAEVSLTEDKTKAIVTLTGKTEIRGLPSNGIGFNVYYESTAPKSVASSEEHREEVEEAAEPTPEKLEVEQVTQFGDTAATIPSNVQQATITVGGNQIDLDTSGVKTATPASSFVSAPPASDQVGQTLTAYANLLNAGPCLSMTKYQLFTSGKPVVGNYGTISVNMHITSAWEGREVLVVIWGPDGGVRTERVKVVNGAIPVMLAEHSYVAIYSLDK